MRKFGLLLWVFLVAVSVLPIISFSTQNDPGITVLLSLLAILSAYLATVRDPRREQEATQELDADAVLVQKIASAMRPSFWLALASNFFWFGAGLVAAAYTPELRAILDQTFTGS